MPNLSQIAHSAAATGMRVFAKNLFSPLIGIVKRMQRSRLRQIMRGYRALKKAGRLDRIATVKQELTEHSLRLSSRDFSPHVMGCGVGAGEIIVRQYLLTRVGGLELNCALLVALGRRNGRVAFFLPKQWRDVLQQHGIKVAHFKSAILWQLYVGTLLLYGVVQIGKITLRNIAASINLEQKMQNYAYFSALGTGNLPQDVDGHKSHDVISWYAQWSGKPTGIQTICHNIMGISPTSVKNFTVLPLREPLPACASLLVTVSYLLWGIGAGIKATVDYLRGRWWHALMLNQAALAAQVRHVSADLLAREYLFHNSGWIYRPLWTYEAEQSGSAITFYFYSTNTEAFKRQDGYPPLPYGWSAMTWPRYLVWDEPQADFVRRAVGSHAKVSIVGQIWFQSSAAEMPHVDKPAVAVFDVTPHRSSRYCTLGLDSEFYTPEVINRFLDQIADVTRQLEFSMLWKRKRKIAALAHPRYRFLAVRLGSEPHVVPIDPDISANRVIERSCAVISLPFTSTALVARAMGKPSVYYDPTGQLQSDDRAAHGIPILSGQAALKAWLSSQTTFQ